MNRHQTSIALDAFDIAILSILQRESHLSQREIAERIHLSAPAVQRRIKRLEDTGVIAAHVAVLNPSKVGSPMLLMIEVQIHNEKRAHLTPLEMRIAQEPAVQQCYFVTGQADYWLLVAAPNMDDFVALTRRLFDDDDNVKRFTTSVVLRRIKVGLELPLPSVPL
ncbi:Lrp/AsnC family transcriptional regulator [Lampropedia puyangensis]|uniref:Lrp/AsnC family transcriptional regulator n=1 Tax=Lampropedia puyangensis TaxID=1330072 RepID=A0A4S8F134_9BURK|nr:Lrp/AsnC family transcriptional regulator [Lampropedia puyangensis]THU00988.1 Lrp/AsnC family transcriptional regulator [Lampropedia puyangensis]